jgi:histidine triad (HIT) family protein
MPVLLSPPDEVLAQQWPCVAIRTNEPPAGSLVIIPVEHRRTPWDLTAGGMGRHPELAPLDDGEVAGSHSPHGWNVGWNVGEVAGQSVEHTHCHLIPRYADEAYAGRGLRWWFKHPDNARSLGD